MKKLVLASALVMALSACQPEAPPAQTEATAPAPAEVAPAAPADPAAAFAAKFDTVLAGAQRSEANRARDQYRHPRETLTFFGIKPGQTVIEISPGGGWYTEILGPLLKGDGTLIAAVGNPATGTSEGAKNYMTRNNDALRAKLAADAASYDGVVVREYDVTNPSFGEPGSADLVVTFRNVHNWTGDGVDQQMFKGFFDVLKAGGTLGVVEHRANPGTDAKQSAETGYINEEYVIGLATAAGFQLAEKSEINANPKDTKDYPKGVWTLPPTLAAGDTDKDKYVAIGESDRMTLRFVKPAEASAEAPLDALARATTSSRALLLNSARRGHGALRDGRGASGPSRDHRHRNDFARMRQDRRGRDDRAVEQALRCLVPVQ